MPRSPRHTPWATIFRPLGSVSKLLTGFTRRSLMPRKASHLSYSHWNEISSVSRSRAAGASPPRPTRRRHPAEAGARRLPGGGRGVHQKDSRVHYRNLLQLAAHRLPARLEDRAHPQGGARRYRRSARHPALLGRRLPLHAHAGEGHPARQSLHHRQDRGRPRDDRRGRGLRTPARHADENRARLAKLADPRTIKLDDAEAEKLVAASTPVYYITGTIHSPETGAPTALMELAYRLAVDESAYIKSIRDNVITLITPVVEADGRDRAVDIYRWHRENPGKQFPPLIYWGHYVAHDNNRDSMGLTLQLTRNVLKTFVGFKAQVLHDLHESVPYLYDNTVGDGPYNAWIDPILADEWQMLGWNNVSEMTKLGMPGVFTHGTFDTWSPSYLMFIGAMHNGISRLYETFGNGGADTEERTLRPNEYARTWFKQNPPLPKTKWSQRNNNNYEQTGVLTALHYFAGNNKLFLRNFYLKAKRSIEKPRTEGPAAYVFPSDDPRPGAQADLLRMLQDQGCEISRSTAPITVMMPAKKAPARGGRGSSDGAGAEGGASEADAPAAKPAEKPKPT